MKDHRMPFLGIGAASIVLVLTIVSLSVFATLTISSANGDYTLSQKNLERTTNYYKASNEVNVIQKNKETIAMRYYVLKTKQLVHGRKMIHFQYFKENDQRGQNEHRRIFNIGGRERGIGSIYYCRITSYNENKWSDAPDQ